MHKEHGAPISEERLLLKVVDHCYEMLELADVYDYYQHTAGSSTITGVMRDAAYKIRGMAQQELNRQKGPASSEEEG